MEHVHAHEVTSAFELDRSLSDGGELFRGHFQPSLCLSKCRQITVFFNRRGKDVGGSPQISDELTMMADAAGCPGGVCHFWVEASKIGSLPDGKPPTYRIYLNRRILRFYGTC